jgi:hypothetical protein
MNLRGQILDFATTRVRWGVTFCETLHAPEHLFSFPIAVGTPDVNILATLAGGTVSTAFGLLLAAVLACSTDAAAGSIFTSVYRTGDGNFRIQRALTRVGPQRLAARKGIDVGLEHRRRWLHKSRKDIIAAEWF